MFTTYRVFKKYDQYSNVLKQPLPRGSYNLKLLAGTFLLIISIYSLNECPFPTDATYQIW